MPFSSTKSPVKTIRVLKHSLKTLGQFVQDETEYGTSLVAKLLHNGDVAVLRTSLRNKNSMLTQYRGAMHSYMPRCVYTMVPGDGNERTANVMLDVYVDTLKNTVDTVICDEDGKMWIKSEEADGHSTSFEYSVVLEKPDDGNGAVKQTISDRMKHSGDKGDLITCVIHPDTNTTLLGTERQEVYCIKHAHGGRVVRCHRLKEWQNLFGTILQKSVGLLWGGGAGTGQKDDSLVGGVSPEIDDARNRSSFFDESGSCISRNGRSVVRLYKKGATFGLQAVLPLTGLGNRLVSVGSSLRMWSGYDEPGREQIEWTWPLFAKVHDLLFRQTIDKDSLQREEAFRVGLVHAEIVPSEVGATSASLLLLALSSTSLGNSTADMWIMRVSLPLRSKDQCEISHVQLVTDTVDMDLALHNYTPSLHTRWGERNNAGGTRCRDTLNDSKVVVTWMAASLAPPQEEGGSLYSAQVDAGALLGALDLDIEDSTGFSGSSSSSNPEVPVVNCEIPYNRVLTVGSVDGAGDLVAFLSDGTVLSLQPTKSLARKMASQFSQKESQATEKSTADDVVRVLLARCQSSVVLKTAGVNGDPFSANFPRSGGEGLMSGGGEVNMNEETLTQLQHSFADMSHALLVDTVGVVCDKIVNRPPANSKEPQGIYSRPHSSSGSNTTATITAEPMAQDIYFKSKQLMNEKVASFYCLVRILEEVGLLSTSEADCAFAPHVVASIQLDIAKWEQQLLGTAGVAESLHAQITKVASSQDLDDVWRGNLPLTLGELGSASYSEGEVELESAVAMAGLKAVSVGMVATSDELISSARRQGPCWEGMSSSDAFFAEAGAAATSLQRVVLQGLGHSIGGEAGNTSSLSSGAGSSRGLSDFSAAFGVMQILLNALRGAARGQGADADTTAFLCSPAMRSAMEIVLEAMLQSAGTAALNAWRRDVGITEGSPSNLARDLRDFCQFSMESWALEAVCEFDRTSSMKVVGNTEDPRHGAHMGQQWKLDCDKTKGLCNRLLLLLDTPQYAFCMAEAYFDFEGLVKATEHAFDTLLPSLVQVCSERGQCRGTKQMGLVEYVLKRYENTERTGLQKGRALAIFEIGQTQPAVLESFLRPRPHLDWVHSLSPGVNKNHTRGGRSALAHLEAEDPSFTSMTSRMDNCAALASIAKLSALVDISSSGGEAEMDAQRIFLAADSKLTCVSLQRALASVLRDMTLLDVQVDPKVALRKALDRVTALMSSQQGSGEAILADIHKLLGLSLDLLRHSFPSDGQERAVSEWNQHVADVWLCTLQSQSALWETLGEEMAKIGSSDLTKDSLTDDDEQAVKGTVFHQLLCTFLISDRHDGAVDVSPDIEKILPILGFSKAASNAVRLVLDSP